MNEIFIVIGLILLASFILETATVLYKQKKREDVFLITGFTGERYATGFTEKQKDPVVNKTIKCTKHVLKDLYGDLHG